MEEQVQTLKQSSVEVLDKLKSRPYFKEIFDSDSAAKEFEGRVLSSIEKEPTPEMAAFEKAASYALPNAINWGLKMKKERDEALAALKRHTDGGAPLGSGQAPNRSIADDGEKGEVGDAFSKAMRSVKLF
jgi:hypothetical protein